jgi:DNA (cytosine-5)-methyltransferase 1
MEKKFRFIDLFAGIGGLRIPFDDIGGECVLTSEKDPAARATYKANFEELNSKNHISNEDITQLDEETVPDHELLLGGFPCQPFSHAGKKLGFEDTRGTLFFDVAKIIAHKAKTTGAPRVIILENVRGLVSHDKGNTYKRILEVLEEWYEICPLLLNAKDFGLPQSRLRIYIVGIRKDLPNASQAKHELDELLTKREKTATRVGNILQDNVDEKYRISDRLWASHQARRARHEANGNGWGFRKVTADSAYTATLSARYNKDGSEILVDDNLGNPRKLTPREAANLQGFPKSFVLSSSDAQLYKQFGNAVAVPVVRFLAEYLAKYLIA